MKTLRTILCGVTMSSLVFVSCQRASLEDTAISQKDNSKATDEQIAPDAKTNSSQGICNPNAYVIILESHTLVNGYWEWVWSVQNPNPGNGNNGTAQDLSHWGMQLGNCVNWNTVISAAYSGDGSVWATFNPAYQADPSQGCMTTPVLKFDFGTSGSARSYYRLVVSQDYSEGLVPGYYKSGSRTGCCTFYFTGISGCGGPVEIVE